MLGLSTAGNEHHSRGTSSSQSKCPNHYFTSREWVKKKNVFKTVQDLHQKKNLFFLENLRSLYTRYSQVVVWCFSLYSGL